MKETLINQINFENWANTELLAAMRQANPLDERALYLFSHLLSSGSMWMSRVKYETPTCALFQERTIAACEQLNKENTKLWLAYLQTSTDQDLKRSIEFVLPFDGSKRLLSVVDAVFHIVHHSSYHRGQIISKLKGSMEPLPLVTYIKYAGQVVG